MKVRFNGGHLSTFELELEETDYPVKPCKTNKNKGSVKEVLGLLERNLKSLVSQRLEDYIRSAYVQPGILAEECELAIPTISKDYPRCEYLNDIYHFIRDRNVIKVVGYHSVVDDSDLTLICGYEARKVINKVKEECKQGISAERKSELERCLEILTGPVMLSGVTW